MAKPKITKIKAKDTTKKAEKPKKSTAAKKATEIVKTVEKPVETKTKAETKTNAKKPFILFRPFVALFRYLRDSWKEIRQVRWPSRKATWKMVLAVLVYTALFVVLISLLDLFFTWLFNLILGH